MIDPKLLGDLAKEHQKNLMTRDEAKAFLKELRNLPKTPGLSRTADQTLRFSKVFSDSEQRTILRGMVDREGRCGTAQIDYR